MSRRNSQANRKALQLAAQVKDALSWVLDSATGDDLLSACSVDSVEPLPGGRLHVTIAVPGDLSSVEIGRRLSAAAPTLRMGIAPSITRRKVPELVFLAVPAANLTGPP